MDVPVLGLVGSAAGGLPELRTHLVQPLQDDGWEVAVTLTPSAYSWLDQIGEVAELERTTGYPVAGAPRDPAGATPHPDIDCYAAAPASANTVSRLALGITGNQALTTLVAAIGARSVPVVVWPSMNRAYAGHPAWPGHIAALRAGNVHLVYGDDVWPLPEPVGNPGWYQLTGREFPWPAIRETVKAAVAG